MGKTIVSQKVVTPVCRLAYPNVFQKDKDEKYSVALLFPKENFNNNFIKTIVDEIKAQLAITDFKNGFPPSFKGNPLRDGDAVNEAGNIPFPGYYYMNAKSNFQPGVVAAYPDPHKKTADGRPVPAIITDEREIYGGVWARVELHAYAYDFKGKKGISVSLGNIQKIRDGEPLGGFGNPAAAFDCYETNEIVDAQGVVNDVDNAMAI